jgi:KRAB domain-containing zinc finger protein
MNLTLKNYFTAHFKGLPPLVCEYCSKRFHHPDSVRKHIKARHSERTDVFKCELCPRRAFFESSKKFEDHQKLHSSKTACECMQCDIKFASYNDLLDHIQVHHKATPNSLDVKCQECKKTFITPTGLRHHVFIDHFSQRCVCEICGQSYSQKPGKLLCSGIRKGCSCNIFYQLY